MVTNSFISYFCCAARMNPGIRLEVSRRVIGALPVVWWCVYVVIMYLECMVVYIKVLLFPASVVPLVSYARFVYIL